MWLRKLNMALYHMNGHLVLREQVDWLKSMLGKDYANTKRKLELILKLLKFMLSMHLYMPECCTPGRTMKNADKSLNLKGDTYLARMHLGQLSVRWVDIVWKTICKYWGFQKMLLCIHATNQFCRGIQLWLIGLKNKTKHNKNNTTKHVGNGRAHDT